MPNLFSHPSLRADVLRPGLLPQRGRRDHHNAPHYHVDAAPDYHVDAAPDHYVDAASHDHVEPMDPLDPPHDDPAHNVPHPDLHRCAHSSMLVQHCE
jgi:hypothetical protein